MLAPCYRYVSHRLHRRGILVLFLCRHAVDPEAAGWRMLLACTVLPHGGRFVVQTREEAIESRCLLGVVDVLQQAVAVYDQSPPAQDLLRHRVTLELLFYGFIRP